MNRDTFLEYIAAFNNKDYDAFTAYYTDDVEFVLPGNRVVRGPDGIRKHYENLHQYVDEVLRIGDLLIDGDKIAAEFYTEFHCIKDYPDFSFGPLTVGESAIMTNFVIYNVTEDGKFDRIRVAHHKMEN